MASHHDEPNFDAAPPGAAGPFQRVANALAAIGTAWIFFLMFLIVADVLGRNFLDRPITGVAEFAGRSVVAIVFLQLGAAIGSGRMTQSEFLLERFPQGLRNGIESLFALVGVALFAILAYISWPELVDAWQADEFFGVRGVYTVPTWPFKALLVIGSVMAAAAYLLTVPALLRRGADSQSKSS